MMHHRFYTPTFCVWAALLCLQPEAVITASIGWAYILVWIEAIFYGVEP